MFKGLESTGVLIDSSSLVLGAELFLKRMKSCSVMMSSVTRDPAELPALDVLYVSMLELGLSPENYLELRKSHSRLHQDKSQKADACRRDDQCGD